ncbi:hypothetical protein GCM10010145_32750 [Streptomyces ruber]|uniref:Uncharacterized protein n=2 Tax=Streptomyces TaxID=1883 RepID=A0A918BDZ5_9ACTN|nr:hypothetical protein GCM10010145_32750 [Streptomyces ruber]
MTITWPADAPRQAAGQRALPEAAVVPAGPRVLGDVIGPGRADPARSGGGVAGRPHRLVRYSRGAGVGARCSGSGRRGPIPPHSPCPSGSTPSCTARTPAAGGLRVVRQAEPHQAVRVSDPPMRTPASCRTSGRFAVTPARE